MIYEFSPSEGVWKSAEFKDIENSNEVPQKETKAKIKQQNAEVTLLLNEDEDKNVNCGVNWEAVFRMTICLSIVFLFVFTVIYACK